MEIIVRDGLVYYLVIMGVSIANFLIWIVDPFASYVAVGLLKCLQSTICSRLLLNIRGMLEPGGTMLQLSASTFEASAGPKSSPHNRSEVLKTKESRSIEA
ncbi:hypothetical protein BJ165DRAFT_1440133 [Panaeolus papilionaceus]|nr:hypothetical protein BJ165DRAFT_1440133 [Panaeolus papilionaceus]